MTWEDARQIIATWLVSSKGAKGQCGYIEGWFDEEDAEAFRMAIEALSADAVSREDGIPCPICNGKGVIKRSLDVSANVVEVVRCKDCRHRDLFSCPLADNDFQKDDDYCSWGERSEE